jgi:transketolase
MPTQRRLANAIRALAMDAVEAANSGHPGMPMGMADAATALFTRHLKHDPSMPNWPDRDRFVLSAGHGSMLIYALLHLTGYERPTIDDLKNFRKLTSPCAGHPENFMLDGVETTTGPLGQGLATAVGMAIAERHLNAEYGDELVDHRTWVIAAAIALGSWPSISSAAQPADLKRFTWSTESAIEVGPSIEMPLSS